jgi:hypothetical protein
MHLSSQQFSKCKEEDHPGIKARPYSKCKVEGMAEVVVHLSSKHETLSTTPRTTKQKQAEINIQLGYKWATPSILYSITF